MSQVLAEECKEQIQNDLYIENERPSLIIDQDPTKWIKENILHQQPEQNFRSKYFGRLGWRQGIGFQQQQQRPLQQNPAILSKKPPDAIKNDSKPDIQKESNEIKQKEKDEQKEHDKSLVIENQYHNGDFSIQFLTKSNQDIRNNYLQKLRHNKILKSEPSKKHQTIIIFDWDDTLLCTTFLGQFGFVDLPPDVLQQINQLDNSASKLLSKAISYGNTYIVTNAAQGWVEYSSKLYYPKVSELIQANKLIVISARSGFEDIFPGDCHQWKIEAFKNIKKKMDENIITNLICLGDSHIELDAAHVLAKEFVQTLIKTIKFRESPKPDELVKQQDLVSDKFEQIYMSIRNLTIRLEKKQSGQQD